MAKKLTYYILAGLVLGVLVGWAVHTNIESIRRALLSMGWIKEEVTAAQLQTVLASGFQIVTTVFLNLIKMIIAPLVFATLVAGIAHMGDTGALGRIGARAVGWFICASLVSLTLGLILVNLLQPGVGLGLELPAATASAGVEQSSFNLSNFITHIFPKSGIDAMANNEILQIVVFSLFIGVAITAVGEKAKPLVRAVDGLVDVMLLVTNYVMRVAPFAVFAAVASVIAKEGLDIVVTFGRFIGSFYLGLVLLWSLLIGLGFIFVGPRIRFLVRYIRDPLLLAFSTASSEAAYPKTLEALDRFGVPRRIASFVLPLGYSFNLDGSMLYMTFATIFIAQAYGIDLTLGQEIGMLLMLMISSKGIAGVPRASLVVILAIMPTFGIPEAGLLLILGVDHFLDMGRSATNVVGNAVASAVVARWEGQLDPPEPVAEEPPHAPSSHHHPPDAGDRFRAPDEPGVQA
jgi:Na+/H+-dicarboxylate symporter